MSETVDHTYPKLLYMRGEGGNSQPIWNLGNFEVLEVADADAEDAALAEGWALSPADAAPAKPASSEFSLLDEKTDVIAEHLPALTDDELAALREAEHGGKTRKGVLAAIDAEIANRSEAAANA